MLRRDRQMRMQIHQLVDACIFAVSFWLAYELRASDLYLETFHSHPIESFERFFWFYLVLIPVSPLVLEAQGFYDRPMICSRRTTLWSLFKGCLFTSLGLTLALFFSQLYIARSVPIWFGLIAFTMVYIKEEIVRGVMKSQVGRSQYSRRFLLVGTRAETDKMRAELNAQTGIGIHIVSALNLDETNLDQVIHVLHDQAINGVILSTRHSHFDRAEAVLSACEIEGIEVWMMAEFFKTQISRTTLDDFYGRPVLVFRSAPEASWQGILKQVMDFAGALIALTLLAIPMAAIAIIIRVSSPGPVFFKQLRSGLNGAPFTVYKFRTMVTNAEQIKHELASMNEMSGPVFKMTGDPRITPFGKWLRKFSVDELPQFFNVLRGEMSLVGPRPLPVDETKRINDMAHRRRLSVRPGITCLWQVSGRSEIKEFKDWVRMDLEYIDNWSLWLDLKILLRTIPAVFCGSGAK